jgi:hypothetical protein
MRGLTLALLLLLNLQAHAQIIGGAPFGLSWGMSKADAERNGIALTESPGATFGKSFSARNLPRVLTDTEQVVLSFGHDDRLLGESRQYHGRGETTHMARNRRLALMSSRRCSLSGTARARA